MTSAVEMADKLLGVLGADEGLVVEAVGGRVDAVGHDGTNG